MDYNLYDGYVYVFCALMDYVVLRTMLLFSRVDVTLHAGGGDAGWVCSVRADSGSTAIQ